MACHIYGRPRKVLSHAGTLKISAETGVYGLKASEGWFDG